jgi:lipid-A-disaccharide synthase
LIAIGWKVAAQMRFGRYDLIVMVDYGAFNLRVAGMTRSLGTQTPIMYYFPPAAWLDDERRARKVTARCEPLTPFTHQRDFYRSLGLPIGWFGHPLVSTVAPRPARPPAPSDGGVIALLPGSRSGELERHTPRLLDALELLRARRPALRGVLAAIDDAAVNRFEQLLRLHPGLSVRIVHSAREALADADGAAVASGTAVLEAALMQVPTVGFYVLSELQARIARRVWHGRFILLPNLILDEPVVPELLQEAATPRALADALDAALRAPDAQLADFRRLRDALGPSDALERCADFALALIHP